MATVCFKDPLGCGRESVLSSEVVDVAMGETEFVVSAWCQHCGRQLAVVMPNRDGRLIDVPLGRVVDLRVPVSTQECTNAEVTLNYCTSEMLWEYLRTAT